MAGVEYEFALLPSCGIGILLNSPLLVLGISHVQHIDLGLSLLSLSCLGGLRFALLHLYSSFGLVRFVVLIIYRRVFPLPATL